MIALVPVIPEAAPVVAVTAPTEPLPINPHMTAATTHTSESPLSRVLVPIVSASQESVSQIEPVPVSLTSSYKELKSGTL